MSKLTYQQRGNQSTRIPVGQRRTAGGKALEDNRAAFAAKQLKPDETAQLTKEEDELLKGKSGTKQLVKKDEEEIGQAKFSDRGPPVQREEQPAKPNNTGLPDKLKNGIESLSGMSMDNVKVHYNSAKPAQMNALAYAQGTDIHVGPGQEQHLPHEAWHVVQQAQGRVKPTMQMRDDVPVNDDKRLEHEADVMGKKTAQMRMGTHNARLDSITHVATTVLQNNTPVADPIQRRLLLNTDDSQRLEPEKLQSDVAIEPPQHYKNLFYKLDDAAENFPVASDSPGNFSFATKTISIPPYYLEFAADRIKTGKELDSDKKNFRTAMAQLGHEMQHAIDYVFDGKKVGLDATSGTSVHYLAVMDTELRAWASEAIVYRKFGDAINQEGKDLLAGWENFDPSHIDKDESVLISNPIWARIIQYSTKNKFEGKAWKECALTGNVMNRASEERTRVVSHADTQEEPQAAATINTLQDLNTNYGDLKKGGNRVTKIAREGSYNTYKFKRRVFRVHKDVVADSGSFDDALGSWAAVQVEPAEELYEDVDNGADEVEPLQLDTEEDIKIKAPELIKAGSAIKKVSRDDKYKVYLFDGRQYKISNVAVGSGYFDLASGEWA